MCRHSTNLGGNSKGDPPVPIPNTVVKPLYADGTWTDTSRESKKPPDTKYSSIAQSVEHSAVNRSVVGSSPTGGVKRSTSESLSIFLCPPTATAFRFLSLTLAPHIRTHGRTSIHPQQSAYTKPAPEQSPNGILRAYRKSIDGSPKGIEN